MLGRDSEFWFERALFVIGKHYSGKSTRIRNMYADVRMGKGGRVPHKKNTKFPIQGIPLSRERRLYVRMQSPQEAKDTLEAFFGKIDKSIATHPEDRWNSAIAVQYEKGPQIVDGLALIKLFIARYDPERVRIVIVNPQARPYATLSGQEIRQLYQRIRGIAPNSDKFIEAAQVDGRGLNGLFLTDFFDFS